MINVSVHDSVSLVCEKMSDINFLRQEIREEYFEKYNSNNENDRLNIAWEYDRYGALFRIMDICLDEVCKLLKNAESELTTQKKAIDS